MNRTLRLLVMAAAFTAPSAFLVLSEVSDESVAGFWAAHPMTGALVSGAALLLLTAGIIDRWLKHRDQIHFSRVASVAFRELGSAAVNQARCILELLDLERYPNSTGAGLKPEERERLAKILRGKGDERWVDLAHGVLVRAQKSSRAVLSVWAPCMVQSDALSKVIDQFVEMMTSAEVPLDALWSHRNGVAVPDDQGLWRDFRASVEAAVDFRTYSVVQSGRPGLNAVDETMRQAVLKWSELAEWPNPAQQELGVETVE